MSAALGGVIAILRGVTPEEVLAVGRALFDGGIRVIEVPLNSPRPFDSLECLVREFGQAALIGAGTVLDAADADRVADAGAGLVVRRVAVGDDQRQPVGGSAQREHHDGRGRRTPGRGSGGCERRSHRDVGRPEHRRGAGQRRTTQQCAATRAGDRPRQVSAGGAAVAGVGVGRFEGQGTHQDLRGQRW